MNDYLRVYTNNDLVGVELGSQRELGFVLMALNIRKVVAQRAENNQFIKRQFLYYFNRNCLFSLIQELYVPDSFHFLTI